MKRLYSALVATAGALLVAGAFRVAERHLWLGAIVLVLGVWVLIFAHYMHTSWGEQ